MVRIRFYPSVRKILFRYSVTSLDTSHRVCTVDTAYTTQYSNKEFAIFLALGSVVKKSCQSYCMAAGNNNNPMINKGIFLTIYEYIEKCH